MLERVRRILSNFKNRISQLIEKYQLFSVTKNNIKRYLLAIIILSVIIITITSSFAATVPVKSVEIKSEKLNYDKKEQGAWKVTKSASWTSKNKARITFDVDTIERISDKNRRIILVLDCSESMNNVNFEKLKNNMGSVLKDLSDDKKSNSLAYIEFNDKATIKEQFTESAYSIRNEMEKATPNGGSSYYSALQRIDSLLKSRTLNENENVYAIFITSGSPNVDTPNETSEYTYLKQQYPYLEIKAIQYGIGDEVLESVKNISDKQYIATEDNIARVLHNTIFGIMEYDDFKITDKINSNYFNIESISTAAGEATINNNTVTWNVNASRFTTGTKKQLNIDIKLKDNVESNPENLYETNTEETITSSVDSILENITSTLSPIISAGYTVTYDINNPPECKPSYTSSSQQHLVFDQVSFPTTKPTCFGYQFKEWIITNSDIEKSNEDYFIMPEENVTVKAIWTKLSLSKSSNGSVKEQATLYNVIKNEADSGGFAREYTGFHQDSISEKGNKKIYHYYAETDEEAEIVSSQKNNVLFAEKCWKMIRTTDTGGVKLLYNGVPNETGSCQETGITPVYIGTVSGNINTLAGEYYYGTSYEYDDLTKKFKLSGDIMHAEWSADTFQSIINKYTCVQENPDDSCDGILYIVDSITVPIVNIQIPIYMLIYSSQSNSIGNTVYNISDFESDSSDYCVIYPSAVGYMYNPTSSKRKNYININETVIKSGEPLFSTIYYSSSYVTSNNKYRLRLPSKTSSSSDYSKMIRKYTLESTVLLGTSEKMKYVVGASGSTIYYIELTYPNDLDYYNYTYAYGDSYVDNGDGTYTINNASTLKRIDWFNNYSKVKNKYMCKLNTNNKCENIQYVTSSTKEKYEGLAVDGVAKHSSGYTYENGHYKLSDDATTKWDIIENETTNVDNMHYACYSEINENNECEKLIYIYNFNGTSVSGIVLENGKDVGAALKEMLYDENVNQKNSIAKTAVDEWYKHQMTNYTEYLEDTVYCSDRSIIDLAGWNPSGGKIKLPLKFKEYTLSNDLSCQNITDRFSLNNSKAQLKYPVGLLTGNEVNLLGNKNIINQKSPYYLLSPTKITDTSHLRLISDTGEYKEIASSINLLENDANKNYGLRPVISLKPNTKYSKGDGSYTNPYIVDTSE